MSIFCSHKVDHYNFGCPHCGTTVAAQEKRIADLMAALQKIVVIAEGPTYPGDDGGVPECDPMDDGATCEGYATDLAHIGGIASRALALKEKP
jgi:hypothetical protein